MPSGTLDPLGAAGSKASSAAWGRDTETIRMALLALASAGQKIFVATN
ncbi:hypothetical protein SUNI508_05220 [Seiridium unicorne]|uniref:Uncharacterized protein n=1 Tax=Seiridium unicorne TaxID=138068 RepID=A0ABR2V633_9PEZI